MGKRGVGGGEGVNKGLRHADYCFLDERRITAGLFAQRLSPGQGSILRALLASATAACLCLCLRSLDTGQQPTEWLMKPPRNSPGRATKEGGRGMKRLSNTSEGTALVDDQKCRRPAVLPSVSPNKSEEGCVIGASSVGRNVDGCTFGGEAFKPRPLRQVSGLCY